MSKQSEEQLNSSPESAEMYSLSSILSEYKTDAVIRNERKLNKKELEQQAAKIIAEMRREINDAAAAETTESSAAPEAAADAEAPENETREPEMIAEQQSDETKENVEIPEEASLKPAKQPEAPETKPLKTRKQQRQEKRREKAVRRYEEMRRAQEVRAQEQAQKAAAAKAAQAEAEAAAEKAEETWEESEMPAAEAKPESQETETGSGNAPKEDTKPEKKPERPQKPEPSREDAMKAAASKLKSLQRRLPPVYLLCILMLILTLLAGSSLGVRTDNGFELVPAMLIVMQLGVMVLGLDVLAKGASELVSLHPGYEALVCLTNAAAAVDAVLKITGSDRSGTAPYCAVASLVLAFAMQGSRMRQAAYRDTLKTMGMASVPTVVTAEEGMIEEGTVLTKKLDGTKGFIRCLLKTDMPEKVYHKTIPFLMILILVLSGAATYLSGKGAFFCTLAALSCAASGFTAAMVFPRPFAALAKKLVGNGAAVAGWSGASSMERAQGIIIRDTDLFPENSIRQNGMKVLSGALAERVVAYTGSVVIASGSGLKRTFGELMRQYNAPLYHVEDMEISTEGGICAFIGQDQVLVGSSAYMNLMGIRVPSNVEVAGALYTAIDHELCGVFVTHYEPSKTVQGALERLNEGRLNPIFAIRDFNITPAMMQQKFRLSRVIHFLSAEDRYLLSREPETQNPPAALLSREGLWHYSETARSSRRMIRMVRRGLGMTISGTVLGLAIVFVSLSKGAFPAVAPVKLAAAMLLWAFAAMMIGDCADGK